MSFIISSARDFIASKMMESPRERDIVFEEHVRKTAKGAEVTKETWAQPTRTWGFWNDDKSNMVYHFQIDPSYKKALGRANPYEESLRK
mmetsp:Transcript_36398/g.102815  ORF Transcript_36398/g.102815 Transcript_36398/m.102815 type:complete len:89 (+) Transcript_36398:185-451(+)|eukprot:CAMPEP_0117648126 /NCGR_PEP_ID=MMETSP0804-20121206/224_1 /TAXON_ID=1074897 /ORGANISM="Tetraselmis astigmatica, Strain CCMP880" /LENGTH=88 /DNA_ID=CAMNT_0005453679 /DNA_START=173 /DNA_END=439 /DNA_ORIENTATION=+